MANEVRSARVVRYRQEVEGDDGWTDWIRPAAAYRLGCCDCGLVHNIEFRVTDGIVEYRAQRNERATAAKRRHRPAKAELAR